MVTYIEFRPHARMHNTQTPTGKDNYDGVKDFMNFCEERNLSISVTDFGHVYGVGDSIIAHLAEVTDEDINRVEQEFKDKLHWPMFVSGYDPRVDVRAVRRFVRHGVSSLFHFARLKKGRRPHEWD